MICALCDKIFTAGWSDEEAKAESEKIFGMQVKEETHAVVCDYCWNAHPSLRGE